MSDISTSLAAAAGPLLAGTDVAGGPAAGGGSAAASDAPLSSDPPPSSDPPLPPAAADPSGNPYSLAGSTDAGAGSAGSTAAGAGAAGSAGTSGFNVVPAELASVAGTFAAQANALGEALQAFWSHIGSVGACWGNDAEGQKFGANYLPGADQMLSDLADLQQGLDSIADALNASSSAYQDADVASTPI